MGSGSNKTAKYAEPVTPPTPNYHVTGVITPDATCNYYAKGTYNNLPLYIRGDNTFYLWGRTGPNARLLSRIPGDILHEYWVKIGLIVAGTYMPRVGATGNAIVSAGGH